MPKPRGKGLKQVRPVMHIFCEGEKTEPNYINGYLSKFGASANLVIVNNTKKNTPLSLVKEAVDLKKSRNSLVKDSFWVVYDRESTAKYADSLHARAYELAVSNSINLAITNVCFEVWLLLHERYQTAQYFNFDDLYGRSNLRNWVRSFGFSDYDKSCGKLYHSIAHLVEPARANATRMNSSTLASAAAGHNRPYLLNPYTDMHLLLNAIDDWML